MQGLLTISARIAPFSSSGLFPEGIANVSMTVPDSDSYAATKFTVGVSTTKRLVSWHHAIWTERIVINGT
jgi:hypothetical protein